MVGIEMHCGAKCRSRQHARSLLSAITKGNTRQIQLSLAQCHNAGTISDTYGRTALHVAASCGKWEVVDWLLSEKGAELTSKDAESAWTALHRALFYGQLTSARLLVSHGANLRSRDREGLTALDIIMKDRLPHVEFIQTGLNEVFTWGDNANFTLGHETELRKRHPEAVEIFRRKAISIKQMVMCKFHSVFLSTAGEVYTSGHGRGGRLGHDNEQTCLEPKLVNIKEEVCCMVSASRDHTVMLMASGAIYSCGLNDCQQLGQQPPPSCSLLPKQMNHKALKGRHFTGVVAARYHTVLYNSDVIYTFGLNAGQLGHQIKPGDHNSPTPRQVTSVVFKDTHIKLVTACDAATVIVTSKGDVYALHQYQTRRIVAKRLDIEQVCVRGGTLDHHAKLDSLTERGGSELTVAIRSTSGKVYLWRSGDPVLRRCAWVLRRPLFVTDMALGLTNLAVVTKDGEAFVATLRKSKTKTAPRDILVTSPMVDSFSVSISELIDRDDMEEISIERVSYVHRAIGITADPKCRNLAVLQAQPNASLTDIPGVDDSVMAKHFQDLLGDADTMDTIHDVILQVGHDEIPAHKYILAFRSEHFHKLFVDDELPEELSPFDKQIIKIDQNIDCSIFRQLLLFIYTDTCDLLTFGKKFVLPNQKHSIMDNVTNDFIPSDGQKVSAFSAQQHSKKKNKSKGSSGDKTKKSSNQKSDAARDNPVRLLQDLAKKFGVKQLVKRLENVKYSNGQIERVPGRNLPSPKLKFYRNSLPSLYDVCIQAEDDVQIHCHKCVLVARLEYFRSMLGSGWIETSNTQALTLPVPGDILRVIIEYVYVDDSSVIKDCQDAEFICNVLVMADQLLITRLKQMCEVTLATLITLRNACELLEFSSMYRADQLKATCQQFVTINLAALLETRSLDVLTDEVIEEFSQYYKDAIPGMSRRRITPSSDWPTLSSLVSLEAELTDVDLTQESATVTMTTRDEGHGGRKQKGKRKRLRTKSSGDDMTHKDPSEGSARDRLVSVSSETGANVELEDIQEAGSHSQVNGQNGEVPWTTIKVRVPTNIAISNQSKTAPSEQINNVKAKQSDIVQQTKKHNQSLDSCSETEISTQQQPKRENAPSSPNVGKSPVDLRSIMAAQEGLANKASAPKSSVTPGSSKKFGRLSQKERKKLLLAGNHGDVDSVGGPTSPGGGAQSPTATHIASSPAGEGAKPKAWATAAPAWGPVTSVVKSFKDLMISEEAVCEPLRTSKSATTVSSRGSTGVAASPMDKSISWGLPMSGRKTKPPSPPSPVPPSPGTSPAAGNPWHRLPAPVTTVTPSSPHQDLCLSEIIRDERRQERTLEQATNKPLALIQMEEEAILSLLRHYQADAVTDEYITVERVAMTLARPTWAATQRHRDG